MRKYLFLFFSLFLYLGASQVQAQLGFCDALFTAYPDTSGQSCQVLLINNSQGTTLGFTWDFGDASYSSTPSPTHTYATSGTYNVCLMLTDSFGCYDTLCQNVTVNCGSGNCQANFSAFPDTTGQSCQVAFSNNSTGSSLSYSWNFGDGNTSFAQYPSHTYANSGTYYVCLTVMDSSSGCFDSTCQYVTINCGAGSCQAGFIPYPDSLCGTYFSNQSTGSNLNYYWNFGDGNTASTYSPYHTYAASGTYNVCLTVWNSNCSDTICQTVTINCGSGNCQANFNAFPDTTGQSCQVAFSNNSTGSSLSYSWNFGDGNTSFAQYPSHTYANSGTYYVCLTVMDSSSGCFDSTCQYVTINCGASSCQAAFVPYPDSLCGTYFSNQSTGSNLNYYWNFGDGNTSSNSNPYHTYAANGTYNACLTVWNSNCSDTICQTVTVNCGGGNCQANFNAFPDTTGQSCQVAFSNNSTGSSLSYSWNFGDGNTSFAQYPSHTYANSGTYYVCLTVMDSSSGCFDSTCQYVTVNCGAGSCQAAFSAFPDSVCDVYFINQSSGSNLNYYWNFGDGNTSNSTTPYHIYAASGTYNICLTVWNSNCSDTICQTVTINCGSGNCQAGFYAIPDTSGQSCQAWFTNTSSGSALFYNWSFGDGNTSYSQNPSHTYASSGTYYVCLTVTDSITGCFDSTCQYVTVNCGVGSCQAAFTPNPDSLCGVYFSNQSSGSSLNYYWNFGDGNTSSMNTPYHTYASSGTYNVCLTVWNSNCSDTICQTVTVNCGSGGNCQAAYTAYTIPSGCSVYFNDNSTGNNLNYFWNFGDGNTSNGQNPTHSFAASGSYIVCLTIWDSLGCSDTTCQTVNVNCNGSSCQAGFTAYPDSGLTCQVWLNDNSTGTNLSYNWNFGDGNNSSAQNPSHTYATSGSYYVCLTISDSLGCVDSTCQYVTVSCSGSPNCQAGFIAFDDSTAGPCGWTFLDNSSGSGLSYWLDFGDGNNTSSLPATHVYASSGTYTACLTIWDSSFNCSDTICTTIVVNCIPNSLAPTQWESEVNLEIYPNPVAGELNLRYELDQMTSVNVKIIDLHGRIISQFDLGEMSSGTHQEKFNTNQLAVGMYLLQVELDGQTLNKKFIKNY